MHISSVQSDDLGREVTDEEIKTIMFSLKENKAAGPDGYNATFFKKAWPIIGLDVTCVICSFFLLWQAT